MSGSQSQNRDGVQDVKADGGTSGLLQWLFDQKTIVQLENAQVEKRRSELRKDMSRLDELIKVLMVCHKGKTAEIVDRV
jgi:hypothetical protein